MNQRYFINISYKGTPFCGWQKQKNGPSVQAHIENALTILLKQAIEVTGAGRTDSGVHARNYIAHFDAAAILNNIKTFQHQFNNLLPYEIAVNDIIQVAASAHARFDATSRAYEYHCVYTKDPFEREYAYLLHGIPDIHLMNEASAMLFEFDDFTSFCKLHSDNKTNICKIMHAEWCIVEKKIIFKVKADRFLRNMVRAIVGTMLNLGFKKISLHEFKNIVESKNRAFAGASAPAHGLYFTGAEYPNNIYL